MEKERDAHSSYQKILLEKSLASEQQMKEIGYDIAGEALFSPIRIIDYI